MGNIKVSIAILNWNSGSDLNTCLSSIVDNTRINNKEIIVVDNGSTDGSADRMKKDYPDATLIKSGKNLGVSVSRNKAFAIAQGEYILALDVDTELKPGAIDILVRDMDKNPEVGLIGAKLIHPDGSLQYSCREFPTIFSKFVFRRFRGLRERFLRKEEYLDWGHDNPAYVGYVIGACQLIRREAMEEVGFLDERVFYGPEDVDYCLRMWKAGWRVLYDPEAVVIHRMSRITYGHFFSRQILNPIFWKHVRALVVYFAKHRYLFQRPGPFFAEIGVESQENG